MKLGLLDNKEYITNLINYTDMFFEEELNKKFKS